ncbi:quinol:cytochrome c oxidoreductase pentaheme cytochrome subunit [Paucimonas lemoignei]|uniref:Quinol:cytochrome c oxidoreductase pentaheme cytochrome subunit n=1 Tax=Paucimonas lemoignei TaxID=29443 RepID=A0A4R3I3G4_PAULE|nr:cytochrome c3 family protein [Paucimonas lemoignei]TCS39361.1 quinol:cytochrome c oxidoreductase pentaheme cytochrome subunit [Paucimonas lemoignei]
MAQAFSRQAVLLIKLGTIAISIFWVAAVLLWRWAISPAGGVNDAIAQPIRFSHKHHVGDDGLDCRYCHTSVEKAAFAGMPSTQICLSCHSQLFLDSPALAPLHDSAGTNRPIHWNRVHDLPDFVYFDHSIHVNKGVACVECHSRVDQMPLTRRTASLEMQWCLNCHRSTRQHIRPFSEVFLMQDQKPLSREEIRQLSGIYQLQSERRLTDCSTCHR